MTIKTIPLSDLRPHPENLRTEYDDEAIDELAASIAGIGLLTPLRVRPFTQEDGTKVFQIKAGHRRYVAFSRLMEKGLITFDHPVQCDVQATDDALVTAEMLVENLQREDIGVLDEARGYFILAQTHKMTGKDIAKLVGKSTSHISKRTALLKLPADIGAVIGGILTVEDAYELAQLPDSEAEPLFKSLRKGKPLQPWEISQAKLTVERIKKSEKIEAFLNKNVIGFSTDPFPHGEYQQFANFTVDTMNEYTPAKADNVFFKPGMTSFQVYRKITKAMKEKQKAAVLAAEEERVANRTPWDIWNDRAEELDLEHREAMAATSAMRECETVALVNALDNKALVKMLLTSVKYIYEKLVNSSTKRRLADALGLEYPRTDDDGHPLPAWQINAVPTLDAWVNEDPSRRLLVLSALCLENDTLAEIKASVRERFPDPAEPDYGIEPWLDGDTWVTDRISPDLEAELAVEAAETAEAEAADAEAEAGDAQEEAA